MRGFFFQTVPDFSPRTSEALMMILFALMIATSAVVLALTPGFNPASRLGIGYGAWWVTGFVVTVVCRKHARSLGVMFISDQEAATRALRWNLAQPLDVSFLRFAFLFALMFLGILPLVHGVQIWQFDSFDWGVFLVLLSVSAPIGLVALLMFKKVETPPRIGGGWTYIVMVALYVLLYVNGASLHFHRPMNTDVLLRTVVSVGAAIWIGAAIVLALRCWVGRQRRDRCA
jgi:hypothetical protein